MPLSNRTQNELTTPDFTPEYREKHDVPTTLKAVLDELAAVHQALSKATKPLSTKKGTLRKQSPKQVAEFESLYSRVAALCQARDLLHVGVQFEGDETISSNVVQVADAVEMLNVNLTLLEAREPDAITIELLEGISRRVTKILHDVGTK